MVNMQEALRLQALCEGLSNQLIHHQGLIAKYRETATSAEFESEIVFQAYQDLQRECAAELNRIRAELDRRSGIFQEEYDKLSQEYG